MTTQEYPYILRRVVATIIDYSIVFGMTWLYIVMFGTEESPGHYSITGLAALFPIAFWFAFIVLTERYLGGTMGHQVCKIKVVSIDGDELFLWQVLKRRIMDALEISWCFGLIAFILVKTTDRSQRLGDLVAKTKVIGNYDTHREVKFDFEN
jgi:uncharacterized RDD family membrane protein YckC